MTQKCVLGKQAARMRTVMYLLVWVKNCNQYVVTTNYYKKQGTPEQLNEFIAVIQRIGP
jgi:hypothetical protein